MLEWSASNLLTVMTEFTKRVWVKRRERREEKGYAARNDYLTARKSEALWEYDYTIFKMCILWLLL
jgi:hypothetical protein